MGEIQITVNPEAGETDAYGGSWALVFLPEQKRAKAFRLNDLVARSGLAGRFALDLDPGLFFATHLGALELRCFFGIEAMVGGHEDRASMDRVLNRVLKIG